MTIFEFILASLACYRLTVLFARDAGPFGVFKKLRALKNGVGPLFGCPYCISIWCAIVIGAGFYSSGVAIDPPIVCACLILSMSAIAIILDRCFTVDFKP